MIFACLYDVYDDGDEVYRVRTYITTDSVRVRVNCMPIAINCDMTCIALSGYVSYHHIILIYCWCTVFLTINLALMEGVRLRTH